MKAQRAQAALDEDDLDEDDDDFTPSFRENPLGWLLDRMWNAPIHWLRFRHNPPPDSDSRRIQDRQGRTYWLDDGGSETPGALWLVHRGDREGYAFLTWHEDEGRVALSDIKVNRAHRRRGLGTRLLLEVEALARQHGATEITGRIVRKDVKAFQDLTAWYERHGYTVLLVGGEGNEGTDDVAWIRKRL